jgi:hypothetical protein
MMFKKTHIKFLQMAAFGAALLAPIQAIASNVPVVNTAAILSSSGKLSDIIINLGNNVESIPQLINGISFIIGFAFIGMALFKVKKHVDFGPQTTSLVECIKYFVAGGFLMAAPIVVNSVIATTGVVSGTTAVQGATGWDNTAASVTSGGLDTLVVNFMRDLHGPMIFMIGGVCFIIGFALIVFALHRLTKTAQEGPRGPAGMGTIASFIVGGLLTSFATTMASASSTLFGRSDAMTKIGFMALESQMANPEYVKNVFSAILAFMFVVGLISVARGLYLFKMSADGNQQATLMGASSHVIAGAMLVNFGQVANMIQNTLGLTTYGILFN